MDSESISDIPVVFEVSIFDKKGGLDDLNNIEFSDELGQEIGEDILGLYSNDQDKTTTSPADLPDLRFEDVEESSSIETEELSLCLCQECNEYFHSDRDLNAHTCYKLGNSIQTTFEQAFQWNELKDVGDTYKCDVNMDYDYIEKYYDYDLVEREAEKMDLVENSSEKCNNSLEVHICNSPDVLNNDKCNNNIQSDTNKLNPSENFMTEFIEDLLKEESMTNQTEKRGKHTREPSKRIRNMRQKKANQKKYIEAVNESDVKEIEKDADFKMKEVKRKQKRRKKIKMIDDRPPSDKRDRSDGGPHFCPQCDKSFCRRSSLAIHLRRHKGEMPFACDRCEKKFVVLYDLDRHMLIHLGQKKFTCFCEICRKPFVSKAGLMQHKNVYHIPMKIYPCDICGINFATKSGLDDHKVTHEEEIVIEYYEPNIPDIVVVYDE